MKEWFCRYSTAIIRFLSKLNSFRDHFAPTTDEYQIKTQILATRVYLVLLTFSLVILVTYTTQINVIENVTVNNPTYNQYLNLFSIYPETLSCSCTTISIAYDQFIYLDIIYHQICHSVYTTFAWRHLIDSTSNPHEISLNFRNVGGPLFYVLNSFCRLTEMTVSDGIIEFNAIQLISRTVLSREIFDVQVENIIRSFISTITREFTRSRQLIRDQIQYNGIMSGLYTNFHYTSILQEWSTDEKGCEFYTSPRIYVDQSSNCSCDDTPFCKMAAFIDDETSFHIPGMYYGCYIVESLLQSNLECFYNQTCIDELRRVLNSSVILNTSALDSTIQTHYEHNETIEHIVDQLMVEQWLNITSHKFYYERCQPSVCTYTYISKKNWLNVLTSIIVPIGGLNLILKSIIPFIIMMFRSHLCINLGQSIRLNNVNILRRIKRYILRFNLFHTLSHTNMDEEYTIRTQIVTTRIYLITIIASLSILALYRSQVTNTRLITIYAPSYNEYIDLYNNYSQSLVCPCTNTNIEYGQFLQIDVRLHQICNSNFISDLYFTYLNPMTTYIPYGDKRRGKSQLQMIGSWCRLAKSSILDDRSAFYVEQLTVYEVLSEKVFDKQIQSLVNVFIGLTKDIFIDSLTVIRQTTQHNILMSGYITNVFPYALGNINDLRLKMGFAFYPESLTCICVFLSNCTEPMSDYYYISEDQLNKFYVFQGLRRGCFVDEATLQSTLECYYNQNCLDVSHSYFGLNLSSDFPALNATFSSRFNTTSMMRDILNEMMVEEWIYTSSHASFYNACQPIYCNYSYITKNSLWFIISIIMGLIGGLNTILTIIIPQLIKCVRRYRRQQLLFERTCFADIFRMEQLYQYWNKGKEKISHLNLFYSRHRQIINNDYDLRTQIISTRIFLIFLFVSLSVLALYTSQVSINMLITIRSPSYDQYSRIYSQYSQSLSCSCTTISIPYDQFLNVSVIRFHQICQSNVLFSGIFTNIRFNIVIDGNESVILMTNYATFRSNSSNCSCQQTSTCTETSSILYDVSYAVKPVIRFTVPGILRGCYILEAFLQSNLICFHNQSCVNDLRHALNTTEPLNTTIILNTTALDPLLPSQFHIDSTLNDIINELMVEEWLTISSHEIFIHVT
ncbi:hypothetical protein I4U23_016917 [Adineta vaga]|nr:hypothetical protein I4U23_016917 [Adineta vaga]